MLVLTDGNREEDFLDFGLSFIDYNGRIKDNYAPNWREVFENYLVTPQSRFQSGGPYRDLNRHAQTADAVLCDTQTHQMVESLLANAMLTVFRDRGYIRARRKGPEDTQAAVIVSKLLEHALGLPGHYREQYGVGKSGVLFGTGIMHRYWRYEERDVNLRNYDIMGGIEIVSDQYVPDYPVFNDVCLTCIELDDFYPDFGHDTCAKMFAAGFRFTVSANEARRMVQKGLWRGPAVGRAIAEAISLPKTKDRRDSWWRAGLDKVTEENSHPAFKAMVGYTIYAETPNLHRDGRRWREITILNGQLVKNDPFSGHAVPFDELTINPIKGRFYGLAPAEVAIYSQDFANGLLRCLANATARMTKGVWVVDANADVRLSDLEHFKGPIKADSVDAIKELNYNPPIGPAFQVYQMVKGMMQSQSGTNAIQGEPGPDRESATGANLRVQNSVNRPELMGQLIERDYLPKQGAGILELCRQYMDDPEEIIARVGNVEHPYPLSAIHADYDLSFVGSRQAVSEGDTANAIERLLQIVLPIPEVAAQFPILPMIGKWMEMRGLDELAVQIGDPQATMKYLALNGHLNPGAAAGNGNGTSVALPPANAPQAQLAGRANG